MGQEFFVKSSNLEAKVRQLLPSQGGLGAGQDLSASTTIIPIVDLTESAEGSDVREDIQKAFSFDNLTFNEVANTTTTIVNNTGYFRLFGCVNFSSTATGTGKIELTDGLSTKNLLVLSGGGFNNFLYDFLVFCKAGDSVQATSSAANVAVRVSSRQIADIDGNLINP